MITFSLNYKFDYTALNKGSANTNLCLAILIASTLLIQTIITNTKDIYCVSSTMIAFVTEAFISTYHDVDGIFLQTKVEYYFLFPPTG